MPLPPGVVVTGGSAKMEGLLPLAEEIFRMPVRLGVPHSVTGLADVVRNPIYATGVGLLMFGSQATRERQVEAREAMGVRLAWERMRSWFQGNF